MPKVYQNDANISAKYNQKTMQQTAAKHVSKLMTNMCLRKGKPYKSKLNISVFTVSPIGCRTIKINTNTFINTYKSLQNG